LTNHRIIAALEVLRERLDLPVAASGMPATAATRVISLEP
jgi:hypothetical protein